MDELQDAIQDARYIGAMLDPTPRPTVPFKFPSEEQRSAYVARRRSESANWLRLDRILGQPLGFYCFRTYCLQEYERNPTSENLKACKKVEFLEEVEHYRQLDDKKLHYILAVEIYRWFCVRNARGKPQIKPKASSSANSDSRLASAKEDQELEEMTAEEQVLHEIDSMNVGVMYRTHHIAYRSKWTYEVDTDHILGIAAVHFKKLDQLLEHAPLELSSVNSYASQSRVSARHDEQDAITLMNNPVEMDGIFTELESFVLHELEKHASAGFVASPQCQKFIDFKYIQAKKVGENDFTRLRVLGKGGFGLVYACTKRNSGALYAMKTMNKKILKSKQAEVLVVNERNILATVHSPFIVCLKYAYQTEEDLVLVLDLRTGGDLAFHLNQAINFSVDVVRLWAAQIILGLDHMHQNRIVYRDLKPGNLLLDGRGNCSISDLGLAIQMKKDKPLTGRCGTRGYWAPEMLVRDDKGARLSYNHTVDYWSLGCVIYELLYGKCPFRTSKAKALHEDKQQAYDIATLELEVEYDSKYFSPAAAELIQGLLDRDPAKRLGANGVQEVMDMAFFKGLNWRMVKTGQLKSTFKPPNRRINAASQADIGSFHLADPKRTDSFFEEEHTYKGWDYTGTVPFQQEIIRYLEWERRQGPITHKNDMASCCTLL